MPLLIVFWCQGFPTQPRFPGPKLFIPFTPIFPVRLVLISPDPEQLQLQFTEPAILLRVYDAQLKHYTIHCPLSLRPPQSGWSCLPTLPEQPIKFFARCPCNDNLCLPTSGSCIHRIPLSSSIYLGPFFRYRWVQARDTQCRLAPLAIHLDDQLAIATRARWGIPTGCYFIFQMPLLFPSSCIRSSSSFLRSIDINAVRILHVLKSLLPKFIPFSVLSVVSSQRALYFFTTIIPWAHLSPVHCSVIYRIFGSSIPTRGTGACYMYLLITSMPVVCPSLVCLSICLLHRRPCSVPLV